MEEGAAVVLKEGGVAARRSSHTHTRAHARARAHIHAHTSPTPPVRVPPWYMIILR